MYQVVLLRKPPRLSHEQWLEIWLGSHTQVAIDTQSTFGYRQNVIVRPLTFAAPPYSHHRGALPRRSHDRSDGVLQCGG